MQFKDTQTKTGLIEDCEQRLFGDNGYGRISGDSSLLYQFTNRINRGLDKFISIAMTADGRWEFDDTNYDDLSIATTSLNASQSKYEFALEHLVIEKVTCRDGNGGWVTLDAAAVGDRDVVTFVESGATTGVPSKYLKRGRFILLDKALSSTVTGGLKVYFKRGGSYFEYSDNVKQPGIPSPFHSYLSLFASAEYAIDRNMPNAANIVTRLKEKEEDIKSHFGYRPKDDSKSHRIIGGYQNNK